ncbi:MAG: RagB/SusD family nutrient uptake outer membrane protein [Bacteroidales bacterium]|nr:RagB/SusD family nutrient uptake outer membrane protein [Bacteroidales bacterium]
MKKTILKVSAILAAAVLSASCIKESVPVGGSVTQDQVSASDFALMSMINAMPASMGTSGTGGYAGSYGDHTDFGIPGIHLRLEHMLEDLATMADNPYYNRFYAYDLNQAQGYQYTYCAYFWDMYYTWIRLANDVIASMVPAIEDGADEETMIRLKNNLGQAYAYRAWCYLDLARLYEPKETAEVTIPSQIYELTVPIVDENTTIEDCKRNPRVKRDEMYAFILEDLRKAEENLDPSVTTFSQPTLMMVYGLYARAYLELGYERTGYNQEMFAKAAEYARKVIDESGKTPLTEEQWTNPTTGFNSASSNNAWIWGLALSSENLNNLLTFTSHMSSEAAWGYACYAQFGASQLLYDAVPDTDFRKLSWLGPNKEEWTSGKYRFAGTDEDRTRFLEGQGRPAAKPYVALKFRPAQGECNDFNVGNAIDYCLMRIEEMYFIEMEAQYHLNAAKGVELLKEFMREYRDASYSRIPAGADLETFKKELLLQKRIEFWGEGILLYDYKRLDQPIDRSASNHAGVFKLRTQRRSPQWNIVITRAEFQSNTAIDESLNNPDPSDKIEIL